MKMNEKDCDHIWWHAPGVHKNLVCLPCGKGLHNVDLNTIDHYTTGLSLVSSSGKMIGCKEKHR